MSKETSRFSEKMLHDLLEVSRLRNSGCGVTGLLLYVSGNFIQLLEGVKKHVLETARRIKANPNHCDINTLLEGNCERRDFQDWSMGFTGWEDFNCDQLAGYNDFLKKPVGSTGQSSSAMRLLTLFKDTAQN